MRVPSPAVLGNALVDQELLHGLVALLASCGVLGAYISVVPGLVVVARFFFVVRAGADSPSLAGGACQVLQVAAWAALGLLVELAGAPLGLLEGRVAGDDYLAEERRRYNLEAFVFIRGRHAFPLP